MKPFFKKHWMFFVVFSLCFFICLFKINDYDIFWHLKIGQIFFDTGKILDSNRFSWTAPQFPWIPTYWLFEVLVFGVFKYFGFTGLILLNAVIHGITWGSLASYCTRFVRSWYVLFLFVVAIDASLFHFMLRPHVFSFLGIALLIQLLDPLRNTNANTNTNVKAEIFWQGALLFSLWANLHSGVVFGVAYLGLFLGFKIFENGFSKVSKACCVLFCVCACASLINPNGLEYLKYVFDHLSMERVIPLEELQPLSFSLHPKYAVLMTFFFGLALTLTASIKRDRWFSLSLLGLSMYLLTKGIRFIPIAFLYCLPCVCFAAGTRDFLKPKNEESFYSIISQGMLALFFVLHIHKQVFTLPENYYRSGFGIHEESFPVKACSFLPQGSKVRLYNSFTVGGYLIWKFDEKVRVFQDGRIHAYPVELFQRIESAKQDSLVWMQLIQEFQINTVLINKTEDPPHFYQSLQKSGWKTLFEDENFFVGALNSVGEKT